MTSPLQMLPIFGIILAALLLNAPSSLANDIEVEFLKKYESHEKQLIKKYVHNRKIRTLFKNFTDESYSGKLRAEIEATTISTDEAIRTITSITEHDVTPHKQSQEGYLWLEDEIYILTRHKDLSYKLESHFPVTTHSNKIEQHLKYTRALLPLSVDGEMRLSGYFGLMSRQRARNYPFVVKSVDYHSTYENGPAVQIVYESGPSKVLETVYLDPGNSYALLHYVSDRQPPGAKAKVKSREHARTYGTMTYGDKVDGVRLPTKYVTWYEMPNGKKVPRAELTYLEYERYKPTDDDFDLEKHFGIKPFPKAPKPKKGGFWSSYWLYGVVAALVVTGGLLLYRRRLRQRAAL